MTEENGRNDRRHRQGGRERQDDRPVRRDPMATTTVEPDRLGADHPVPAGTESSASLASRPVSVETDMIAATLVDVPLVDVRDLVYDHQIDHSRVEAGDTTQPVALFDLHNVGSVPIKWSSSRTRFIGSDGYTYKPAQLSIDPGELGPGIHTRRVEIRPDRRARVATLVEQLPAGVEVVEVVQEVTVTAATGDTEQLVFDLA